MSELSELLPEERGLLIGLPYRVGVWMSQADDEDGEADDIREMKALEHILKSIAKVHENSVFVQEIARETLRGKNHWSQWANHSFDVLGDCEKAVAVLKNYVNDNDLKDYKATLMEIAQTVAESYGEFGLVDAGDDGGFGAVVEKITGLFSKKDANHPMNISPAEDSALSRLAAALRVDED